jgi:threonine/homoserine/homoserine lactone efflux protein
MNPNDLIAQQQAIVNQALQTQQNWVWGMIAVQVVFLLIAAWVVYMFYARLRDIAEELMKLRIAYEFAHGAKASAPPRRESPSGSPANPFQSSSGKPPGD